MNQPDHAPSSSNQQPSAVEITTRNHEQTQTINGQTQTINGQTLPINGQNNSPNAQNQNQPPRHHRPSFVPYGRKKGKLTAHDLTQLQTYLPTLAVPQATDRASLLEQLRADPEQAKLCLEVGFGNGQFLAHLAERYREDRFIGVEVFLEGVAGLMGRLRQAKLHNVCIMAHNIHEVLLKFIPPASLDQVIINFPDPWPKRSHHKRRIIQTEFLTILATRMRPKARLTLATDWPNYANWMLAVLEKHDEFQNCNLPGHFAAEPSDWMTTSFQQKANKVGRSTFHLAYWRRMT